MTEPRRPNGRDDDPAPEEQGGSQPLGRHSREGGDAPAAGTVAEREALARGEDDTWGDEREPGRPDAEARSHAPEDG